MYNKMVQKHLIGVLVIVSILIRVTDSFEVIKPRETGRYMWENEQYVTYYCSYCPMSVLRNKKKFDQESIPVCIDKNPVEVFDDYERENRQYPFCNENIGTIPNCGALPVIPDGKWICGDRSSPDEVYVYSTCTLKCNNTDGIHHDTKMRCNESRMWDDSIENISCRIKGHDIETSDSVMENTTKAVVDNGCSVLRDISDGAWKCSSLRNDYVSFNSSCVLICDGSHVQKNDVTVVCLEGQNGSYFTPHPAKFTCPGAIMSESNKTNLTLVLGICIPLAFVIMVCICICIWKCRSRSNRSLSPKVSSSDKNEIPISFTEESEDPEKMEETANGELSHLLPKDNNLSNGIASSAAVSRSNGHITHSDSPVRSGISDQSISTSQEFHDHVSRQGPVGQSLGSEKGKQVVQLPNLQKSVSDSSEVSDSLGASDLYKVLLNSDETCQGQQVFESTDPMSQRLDSFDLKFDQDPLIANFDTKNEDEKKFPTGKEFPGKNKHGGSKPKIINRKAIELQSVELGKEFAIEVRVLYTGDSIPDFTWTLKTIENEEIILTKPEDIHSCKNLDSFSQTYVCKQPRYINMGKYTIQVANEFGFDSVTVVAWDFDCLSKCEMTIDKIFDLRVKEFVNQLCYSLDRLHKIPEEMSWKGLAMWFGHDKLKLESTEWHKKGNPQDGPSKYVLTQLLKPAGCTLGHLLYYFSLPLSKNNDVLSCIEQHCADHCHGCEICSTILQCH